MNWMHSQNAGERADELKVGGREAHPGGQSAILHITLQREDWKEHKDVREGLLQKVYRWGGLECTPMSSSGRSTYRHVLTSVCV